MEECYLVNLNDEKYPSTIPVVETEYETVNIVQLYTPEFLHHTNQVITVTPPSKTSELHPLEIEVQRSIDVKRQMQLTRFSNNSVIQSIPNPSHVTTPTSIIRRLNNVVSTPNDDELSEHKIIRSPRDGHFSKNRQSTTWPSSTTYSGSSSVDNLAQNKEDTMPVDTCNIPLTIQHCVQNSNVDSKTEEEEDSVSDDEQELLNFTYDHEPDPEPPSSTVKDVDMTNRCYMCFKKFRQKKNMYAHIRKIHSSQPKIQGGIICPLCKMHSLRQEHLRSHLETLHHVQIVKEERQFKTIQEFNDWKNYIEKETFSYFISKSSTKLLAFNQTKAYYKCHRSGIAFNDKNESQKKSSKKTISYKIGATCPAAMEVIENAHGITVTFWATHVGHNLLSKNDSSRVRGLLSSGMSWDQALDEMERETEEGSGKPKKDEDANQMKYVLMDKKIISLGRKPKQNRLTRSASQSTLIEKAELLLNVLETTEVMAVFRPLISNMIDNLTSIVKRRVNGNEWSNNYKKRKRGLKLQGDVPVFLNGRQTELLEATTDGQSDGLPSVNSHDRLPKRRRQRIVTKRPEHIQESSQQQH